MPPKKDFKKLAGQFASEDADELARQQDAALAQSMESLQERERERILNKARSMGLVLVNEQDAVSGALQVTDDGGLTLFGCEASAAGLEIPESLQPQEFEGLGALLFRLEDGIQLYIGDYLASYERLGYGDISRLAEAYHRNYKTLSNWKWICANVATSLRKEVLRINPQKPLTIGHYNLVAALSPDEQWHWLSQAAQNQWSVAMLQEMLKPKILTGKALPWERALDGLEQVALKKWAKMDSIQRQAFRNRIEQLLEQLEQLEQKKRRK